MFGGRTDIASTAEEGLSYPGLSHPIFGVQSQPQPKWCDLICRVVSVSEPEIWRVCVRPLSGLSAGNLISANFSHQIGSRTHRAQGHRSTYICMDPLSGLGGILGIFGGSFAATVSSTSALFWHSSRPHHFFYLVSGLINSDPRNGSFRAVLWFHVLYTYLPIPSSHRATRCAVL